jgi:hypothetical protein
MNYGYIKWEMLKINNNQAVFSYFINRILGLFNIQCLPYLLIL